MPQTPETRAEERWPYFKELEDDRYKARLELLRIGCATTIREQIEPLEAERDRLRALVQEVCDNNATAEDARDALMDAQEMFKAAGFVPTNTEDK